MSLSPFTSISSIHGSALLTLSSADTGNLSLDSWFISSHGCRCSGFFVSLPLYRFQLLLPLLCLFPLAKNLQRVWSISTAISSRASRIRTTELKNEAIPVERNEITGRRRLFMQDSPWIAALFTQIWRRKCAKMLGSASLSPEDFLLTPTSPKLDSSD